MKKHDFTLLLLDILVPDRLFNVRGLCRMHGLPDITEHLERMNWIAHGKNGQRWTGPTPGGDDEITKLANIISGLAGKQSPKKEEPPAPVKAVAKEHPERKKMTIVPLEHLRPMLNGLETWKGEDDERYRAMIKELIDSKSVAFTILPWKYKLPYAVVPVCKSLHWVTKAKGSAGTSWMGPAVNTDEEIAVLADYLRTKVSEYVKMLRER